MIFILSEYGVRVGVIKDVVSAERLEEINGENTLDFSIKADSRAASLITNSSMFELDGQYFDLAVLKQEIDSSGENIISVEADHISYRLNHTDYDLDSFYRESTTSWILYGILNGTEFSSGGCEVGTIMQHDIKEKTSRRQLLMDFAELVGGELEFDGFIISIVAHRGSSTPTVVLKDKHINIVSRTFNNRTINREGQSTITYQCTPIYDPSNVFNLGDEVELRQGSIGINETLRANRISINPYDPTAMSFELTEYSTELKSSIRYMRSWSLTKGAKYAGVSLDSENGLLLDKPPTEGSPEQEDPPEAAVEADPRYATIKANNVDGILVTTKDDAGVGTDQLYLEHDDVNGRTNLVFDGKLGDDASSSLDTSYSKLLQGTVAEINENDTLDVLAEDESLFLSLPYLTSYTPVVGDVVIYGSVLNNYYVVLGSVILPNELLTADLSFFEEYNLIKYGTSWPVSEIEGGPGNVVGSAISDELFTLNRQYFEYEIPGWLADKDLVQAYILVKTPPRGPGMPDDIGDDVSIGIYGCSPWSEGDWPRVDAWGTPGPTNLVSDILSGPFDWNTQYRFELDIDVLKESTYTRFEIAISDEETEPTDSETTRTIFILDQIEIYYVD